MRSRRVVSLLLGFGIVAACQGASDSDLFDKNAAAQLDGSSLQRDGESPGQTSSGSSSGDPSSSSGGSTSSSSGTVDAAPDAPPIDLDPTGVFCSLAGYCSGLTPLCCAAKAGSGPLGAYVCKDACLPAEVSIGCDDDADCGAGEVCCINHNTEPADGVPTVVQCKAAGACVGGEQGGTQTKLCDLEEPDTCPAYKADYACHAHGKMAEGFGVCD